MQIELIQPGDGASIYREFLDERPGGGVHHVAVEPEDMDAAVDTLVRAGHSPLQSGEMAGGAIRFAYFDVVASAGLLVEIIEMTDELKDYMSQASASS